MLTQHTVAAAAAAAGLGAPARYVEVTGSTSTDLWAMARGGAPEWSLLAAGAQESGRGRLGRRWVSVPGGSLQLSLLLRPAIEPAQAPLVSLGAAVAMATACQSATGVQVGCKWPNDLVAGSAERKLGGILAEASVRGGRLEFLVLGVGVNLTQREADFPPELRDRATSLLREGGRPGLASERVLEGFLRQLKRIYGERGSGIGGRVLEPYRELAVTLGRLVRATTTDGREIRGRAVALGEAGQLILQGPNGREVIGSGEVQHLRS